MSVVEPPTIAGGPPPYRETPAPHASAQRGVPWLTVIILWSAAGIALLSVSYALARANVELDAARLLYWAALAAIAGPALVRMLAPSASRSERILLVALTTLFLYWIKVLHDPVGLFIPDEFYHLANAQRLAETGQLYGENLLLPVSPDYPGLTVITVALSKLSGLGLFPCALVLVGIVKIGLAVVLFLLFERLSGSARIGGVAALLYCAHSNYLYFTSQFSYESLSVPLLACVLLCLVARNGLERPQRAAWSAIGCLLTCAVVVTHHLTAYALVVILWAQVVLTLIKRRPDVRPPLAMAVVATTASVIWAMTVAGETGGYLGSIFDRLDGAISESVRTEAVTRVPFQSGTGGNFGVQGPPLDDRLFSVAAVLLVTLGVFTGLIVTWRRRWRDPFVVLLGLAALAAIGAYPLRLHPASWEISNRTSEFLFLGVCDLLRRRGSGVRRARPRALARLRDRRRRCRRDRRRRRHRLARRRAAAAAGHRQGRRRPHRRPRSTDGGLGTGAPAPRQRDGGQRQRRPAARGRGLQPRVRRTDACRAGAPGDRRDPAVAVGLPARGEGHATSCSTVVSRAATTSSATSTRVRSQPTNRPSTTGPTYDASTRSCPAPFGSTTAATS